MKAIESIYAGYVEQTEQVNTPAVEVSPQADGFMNR